MALPQNALSVTVVPGVLLPPDNWSRASDLVDYDLGPNAVGDPSLGLNYQVWQAELQGNNIVCFPYTTGTPQTVITTDTGITALSFSFDQNARPYVVYQSGANTKLYWYDSSLPGFTTTTYTGISSFFLSLDEKRSVESNNSDVLFLYIRSSNLYYRQQRDRFLTERLLKSSPIGGTKIVKAGQNNALRFQIHLR